MAYTDETVAHEISLLEQEIRRLGEEKDGKVVVKFGKLIRDEKVENTFESIIGTLRAAKKKGIISYEGQMLLQGTHDDVDIIFNADKQ